MATEKINGKETNAMGGNSLGLIYMNFIGILPSAEHMIILSVERKIPSKYNLYTDNLQLCIYSPQTFLWVLNSYFHMNS